MWKYKISKKKRTRMFRHLERTQKWKRQIANEDTKITKRKFGTNRIKRLKIIVYKYFLDPQHPSTYRLPPLHPTEVVP